VEQQPEPRATVGLEVFAREPGSDDVIPVTVTLEFPKGKGLTAVNVIRKIANENLADLVRTALLDDATRRRVQDAALDTLIGKAAQS
jgi:hypothetical protein